MSLSGSRRFTFTWKVQNFSMCPQKPGKCLHSPVFVVDVLKKSGWYLKLYPRSEIDEDDDVVWYLECENLGSYVDDIYIGLSLTVCSVDSTKNVTKEEIETFEEGSGSCRWRVSRRTLFEEKDSYLPNDTLTLQCSLWKPDAFEDALDNEVLATVSRDDIQYSGLLDTDVCSVVSRVLVQRRTVSWPIKSFSSISPNERLTIRVRSALKDSPPFYLTLYKSVHDQMAKIEIQKGKVDTRLTIVKCKISVNSFQKGVEFSAVDRCVFEPDSAPVWKFPSFIRFAELQENKYLELTNDVLYLRFEFAFTHSGDLAGVLHVEQDSSSRFASTANSCPPIREFEGLYRDEELSDVTVRADEVEFKVHRNILRARSRVFRAMFDSDMKEKKTGVVDIADVDPETLNRMMHFVYTNAVEEERTEDVLKLYSAADKYEVTPLKFRCSWILASTLSVLNVCDVLMLADLHQDKFLYDSVECFVHANSDEIFRLPEWKDLVKSNGAAKVMHKMLIN